MKKIVLLSFILVLMSCLVLAQGQNGQQEPGAGAGNPEAGETGQGTGEGLQINAETETQEQQQNQGEETQLQNEVQQETRLNAGEYVGENGQGIQVQEQNNNRTQLRVRNVSAHTSMELNQEQVQNKTRLKVKLSNGMGAEIKVMPDTASERALEALRLHVCSEENNCVIELKEVGQGEGVRAAYEIRVQKEARIFGIFKTKMQVQAQVDGETGEVIQTKKPWWAFLAVE